MPWLQRLFRKCGVSSSLPSLPALKWCDGVSSGSRPKQMRLLDGYWASGYLLLDWGSQGWRWSNAGSCCEGHHSTGTGENLPNDDNLDIGASSFCLGASEYHEHIWVTWKQTLTMWGFRLSQLCCCRCQFCGLRLCGWVSSSWHFKGSQCLSHQVQAVQGSSALKMEALQSFNALEAIHPRRWHHVLDDLNLQTLIFK